MRLPRDQSDQVLLWISEQKFDALLYFAQLMNELLAHQSTDSLRAVSLDGFHRLREIERTWAEAAQAGLSVNIEMLIDELRAYLARDPIVTRDFASTWEAIQPRLKSAKDRPVEAIEAVRYLAGALEPAYLRKCRDYIERAVSRGQAKDKREFRFVVECLCSYLLNVGYRAPSIYFRVQTTFFDREVTDTPVQAVRRFFSHFPHNTLHSFVVGFAVTDALADVLARRREFTSVGQNYHARLHVAGDVFERNPQRHVFSWSTEALDIVDARARCETHLAGVRAVAYTTMPYAELDWDSHFVVTYGRGLPRTVILKEPVDILRRGRRRIRHGLGTDLGARLGFFLEESRDEDDRNRLINALTIYASAFHSESPASQLLSLWSSLEGILPTPTATGSRIGSFARDVVACHKRLQFQKKITTLHYDLFANYRESYSSLLNRSASAHSNTAFRLSSTVCLAENVGLLAELGNLCATNPLARQRLFEVHKAGQKVGLLYGLVSDAAEKVRWQLHRIYRERNRIVHRASPSANVETLILTLNAYILTVFDALLELGSRSSQSAKIDDLFAEIRISEEAREHKVSSISSEAMTAKHLELFIRV